MQQSTIYPYYVSLGLIKIVLILKETTGPERVKLIRAYAAFLDIDVMQPALTQTERGRFTK
jgi:hypothetical protein